MSKDLILFEYAVDERQLQKVIKFCKKEGIPYDRQERCTMSFQSADIEMIMEDGIRDGSYDPAWTLTQDEIDEILRDAQSAMDCGVGLSWENFYQAVDIKLDDKYKQNKEVI